MRAVLGTAAWPVAGQEALGLGLGQGLAQYRDGTSCPFTGSPSLSRSRNFVPAAHGLTRNALYCKNYTQFDNPHTPTASEEHAHAHENTTVVCVLRTAGLPPEP
jgi:hypothetical protein